MHSSAKRKQEYNPFVITMMPHQQNKVKSVLKHIKYRKEIILYFYESHFNDINLEHKFIIYIITDFAPNKIHSVCQLSVQFIFR